MAADMPAREPLSTRVLRAAPWVGLTGALVAVDQLSKRWAELHVQPRVIWTLVPDLLDLRYVRNPAAFFGLGTELQPDLRRALLCIASICVLALISGIFLRTQASELRLRAALCLLASGAVGNLIDRAQTGEVIDFVHLQVGAWLRFATFNLADVAIVLGACVLASELFRPRSLSPQGASV